MAKTYGVDSFQIAGLTTAARRLVNTKTAKRQVQSAILSVPSGGNDVLVGGPDSQVFVIPAGSSLNLGDLFMASSKTEIDLYHVWVKSDTGTVTLQVIHDRQYNTSTDED